MSNERGIDDGGRKKRPRRKQEVPDRTAMWEQLELEFDFFLGATGYDQQKQHNRHPVTG